MLRRTAPALALLVAAFTLAPPAAEAQHATVGAWIYDRTDDFGSPAQRFRLNCGTGLAPSASGEILLATRSALSADHACAGAEAFADATGGALRVRTRVTGGGVTPRPFDGPYAAGAGSRLGRVAQASASFSDVLAFGISLSGTVRFEYALTGERRETPGTPPAGAGPTAVVTRADVGVTWGEGPNDFDTFVAPLGATDVRGWFEVPVVGSSLGYLVGLGSFARLTASLTDPTFALVGDALADFAHTLRIERIAVLDAAGADVTASAGLS